MASNIQIAAQAIEDERTRHADTIGHDPAIHVVMRLQLREQQLLELLGKALEREATLAEQMREVLGVLD